MSVGPVISRVVAFSVTGDGFALRNQPLPIDLTSPVLLNAGQLLVKKCSHRLTSSVYCAAYRACQLLMRSSQRVTLCSISLVKHLSRAD